MTTITASRARANLYGLVNKISTYHEPIQITGKEHNAILISEEDWNAINETLYLVSIPGMRKSIMKGLKTPINNCTKKIKW